MNFPSLKVGIIGAGLIGNKRAKALLPQDKLTWVCDVSLERAKTLADAYQAKATTNPEELIKSSDVDVVIVATSNKSIPELSLSALKNGKSVLVEKPAGRNPIELREVYELEKNAKGILRVGFNHRFHPALLKAKKMIEEGAVGDLMYFRARYGHGGRIGYDKEWRAVPEIAGGGELLDQGVHLIDLCRWMGGEFELEFGRVETFFWDMPVEDNGFMLLKAPNKNVRAFLHASCTEWKNLFDFEIFGRTGKLQIFGIGRSYGVEELRFFKMKPEMGPPDITIETFPGEDLSWNDEWLSMHQELSGKKTHLGTIYDALRSVEIVHASYQQSGCSYAKR